MTEAQQLALSKTNFTDWDWAIVAGYLGISLVIGLFVRKHASSMSAFVTAGRGVGTWLGIATMTGTELGLITVMYSAEKGFKGGFAAFHIALIAGVVTLVIGLTGFIVGPLRRQGVLTIPEFYEKRFNRRTRILGGIVLALGGIVNMGLFLKVGSMFIVAITGLSSEGIALPVVMTVLLVLVLAYTMLGGMISVVLTDYVQFVVLSFGMLVTTFYALNYLGWDNVFSTIERTMGAKGFDPLVSEGTFGPEYVLWMIISAGLVGCAIWPTAVARALAMESEKAVRRQYTWSSVSFTIRFMIPYVWGICAFVFIVTQASDLKELFFPGEGANAMNGLYATPIFLARILPAGVIGLISAAMIAAFMSTHDSYFLTWSSVITQDIVAPLRRERLTTKNRILLTRIIILILGIYVWFWGLWYKGGDDIWDYMVITGAIYFTGAIPVLIGGLYWKRASSTGAFWSLIAGCVAVLGLEPIRVQIGMGLLYLMGKPMTSEGATALLTGERVGLFSIALTTLVFVVLSLCCPDREKRE